MPWDREHDVGLPYGLLDVLRDIAVAEQPLGKHHPNDLCVGHHLVQWENTRHQGSHPPRVIPLITPVPQRPWVFRNAMALRSHILFFSLIGGPHGHDGGTSSTRRPEKIGKGAAGSFFR